MRRALAEAGVDRSEVGHINCHGTGTKYNHQAESDAASTSFGLPGRRHRIKSITGHPGAAAGGVEVVALALTIERGLIPQTQWSVTPIWRSPPTSSGAPSPGHGEPTVALSNSVGLGGQNGTLVLAAFSE